MVLKYVSDHNGKISVSVACTDLGIPQERLRESLKRLVEKGLLNK
jgi:DNA-binding IclR family transcriptional regulator